MMLTTTHPAPRRKDALATRERLIRAGLELFTSQGYRGTTTLDIAARARIAEATIYRHFIGKEALFNEGYRQALRWGLAVLTAAEADRGALIRARLARIAKAIVEHVPKDAALVTMLLRRHDGATLEEPSLHLNREFRDRLSQLVAAGKQEGAIRPGSADLWGAVWLALVTFAVEKVAAKEWAPEHPSVAATVEAAWSAVAYRAPEPG
jgi:AcrR family transcriptional regulator